MGIRVKGEGSILIPAGKLDDAYEALVELNRRDDLKSGYSPFEEDAPSSKSVSMSPSKNFAWMAWNYDELFSTAAEILERVGFEVEETDDGIDITYYNDKKGDEREFIEAIAPFTEEGSMMEWLDEYGNEWRWVFEGTQMIEETI